MLFSLCVAATLLAYNYCFHHVVVALHELVPLFSSLVVVVLLACSYFSLCM